MGVKKGIIMNKKINIKSVMFLLVVCALAFLLLPTTSPLSIRPPLGMVHDYFNFSKSMLQGKLLYVDLYDHKGILLYLLYFIPVLISDSSLFGVFLIEGIVVTMVVFQCYRYCRCRFSETKSFVATLVVLLVLYTSFSQVYINTEAFCLLFIFTMLRHIEEKRHEEYRKLDYLLYGFLFSLLFWMKYPMVIMMFPFFLYICNNAVKKKELQIFVKRCFISFSVFAIISSIILLYFNNCGIMTDMINVYFKGVKTNITFDIKLQLLLVLLGILFVTFSGILLDKNKQKTNLFFAGSYILIFVLFSVLSGEIYAYNLSYIVFLIAMYLPVLMNKKRLRIFAFLFLFMGISLNTLMHGRIIRAQFPPVKEIAVKHHVTNNNVLYLCEDIGFGTYFSDAYRLKNQWKPGKMPLENNDYYETVMSYLKEKEFEYVCINESKFDHEIDFEKLGQDHKLGNIVYQIQENYEEVERFHHISLGVSEKMVLCKRKSNN